MTKKLVTSAAAIAVAAMQVATFSTSASAHGPRGPDRHPLAGPPPIHARGYERHAGPPPPRVYERHRRGNNGAAIALGIGALMLGAVIASEASKHRYDD